MELVVGKVLQKHGVIEKKPNLDSKEKKKIAEIVTNIQSDVELFLENTKVAKTEKDFPESNEVEQASQLTEQSIKKNSVFKGENDLDAVKRFL